MPPPADWSCVAMDLREPRILLTGRGRAGDGSGRNQGQAEGDRRGTARAQQTSPSRHSSVELRQAVDHGLEDFVPWWIDHLGQLVRAVGLTRRSSRQTRWDYCAEAVLGGKPLQLGSFWSA